MFCLIDDSNNFMSTASTRRQAAEATLAGWKAAVVKMVKPSAVDTEAWHKFQQAYPIQASGIKNKLSSKIGWDNYLKVTE
jgi:hypothetical protein